MDTLNKLEMFKVQRISDNLWVTKVPGGYIYETKSGEDTFASVFVPELEIVEVKEVTAVGEYGGVHHIVIDMSDEDVETIRHRGRISYKYSSPESVKELDITIVPPTL